LQQPRARQQCGVGHVAHLEDVEFPLHEGNDPLVMEVGDDRGRSQSDVRQTPQRGGERLRPLLARGRRNVVVLGVGLRQRHLAGVGKGRHRRCGGRTTPSPNTRCSTSSCTPGTAPCASPAVQTSSRRCGPPGAPASRS
jgi:hypothetical protein